MAIDEPRRSKITYIDQSMPGLVFTEHCSGEDPRCADAAADKVVRPFDRPANASGISVQELELLDVQTQINNRITALQHDVSALHTALGLVMILESAIIVGLAGILIAVLIR